MRTGTIRNRPEPSVALVGPRHLSSTPRAKDDPIVALRTPDDLPTPEDDGLLVRSIAGHSWQKAYYISRYTDTAATALQTKFRGRRAYVDLFAGPGICTERETDKLSWGSGLMALQINAPFDLYVLNDIDAKATSALAVRAGEIKTGTVFEVDLRQPDAGEHLRDIAATTVLRPPKVVITTGDANWVTLRLAPLLDSLGKRRYVLGIIDPTKAIFDWDAFEALAMYERAMDVLAIFPDVMGIMRALPYYMHNEASAAKLSRFLGPIDWRPIVKDEPRRAEHRLCEAYEEQMRTLLDFHIGNKRGVGPNRLPLYHLIFGSKRESGMDLWNSVTSRQPNGQDELFLGV